MRRFGILCLVALASAFWACGGGQHRTKPVEVPIGEFEPGKPGPNDPRFIEPTAPDDTATPDASVDAGPTVTEGSVVPATKLDEKGGFAGASFGATPKSMRGIKSLDKKGADPAHYKGSSSYGGVGLSMEYTFSGGKLSVIAFTVKKNTDCKKMRDAIEREIGSPQRIMTGPDGAVWKGNKLALKFLSGVTCGGTVVHRDLSATEFDGIDQ